MCDLPWIRYAQKITPIYVQHVQAIIVIVVCDLYCCLVPQCEALRTCHLGFPITTKWCCDQDVKVMLGATFTKRMCGLL